MTQNLSTPLSSQWVADAAASFLADPAARLAGNAVATTDVETVSLDRAVLTSIDSSVSDLIPDAAITDQKRSGRCWAFAGLNTLRAAMIKDLGLEGFSLSQNFIYFHDKLEKANAFLNRFTADMVAGRDLEDREVVADLASPAGDGGWWPEFAHLVAKYGMVPAYVMPDTQSATDSQAMNDHLDTLLRRAALRIRAVVEPAGDGPARDTAAQDAAARDTAVRELREAAMADVYRLLAIHLGTPPSRFVWQYRNKDKQFTRVGTMTPREFARRYAPDVDEFVVVVHDPRPQIRQDTLYAIDRSETMVGQGPQTHVAASLEVVKAAAVAAVQDGEPVWFACDVAKQRDKKAGVWDAALHDYEGLYGVGLSMTKAERLVARESAPTHAMCLTGVDLVDGTPRRWRVENSWGEETAEKGFWTMNDSWFDQYVYQVVVRADRLPQATRSALEAEPVLLPSWDPMV